MHNITLIIATDAVYIHTYVAIANRYVPYSMNLHQPCVLLTI